jgi:hypothetical protein
VWSGAILFAFIGWGLLVSSVSPRENYQLGMLGVFGVSFTIVVGGFLNLLKEVSPFAIKAYVSTGLLLAMLYGIQHSNHLIEKGTQLMRKLLQDKILLLAVFAIVVFMLMRVALSLSFYGFHGADDDQGYLVFPAKMVQTGELGPDPFSERRLVSSLGGKYFLDTFIVSVLDYKYSHSIDNVVSYILYLLLLYALISSVAINKYLKIVIFCLPLIIASPTGNVTSVITSALLLLGLLTLLFSFKKNNQEAFIIVPLIVAAIVVSKSNMIVPVAILTFYYYYLLVESRVKGIQRGGLKNIVYEIVRFMVIPAVVILFWITPWMVSMYRSSGTLLYPLFGKGYHGVSYGNFLSHYFSFDFYSFIRLAFELYGSLSIILPLLSLLFITLVFKVTEKRHVLVLLVSVALGMLALIYATGGYSLYYYSFSFAMPVILFCLVMLHRASDHQEKTKLTIATLVISTFMLGVYIQKGFDIFQEIKGGVNFENGVTIGFFNKNPTTPEERERYKNLQGAVPAHETILAVLDKNFLLDFNRNQVFIADSPGAASFPPGIPMFQGETALSDYLLSKNIKYVACSCGEKANFSISFISGMLKPHVNPWLKTETMNMIDFHENFGKLAQEKKVVYDDGTNIVLDLSKDK